MLKEAGAEHGKALIVNTASIAGKHGQGWLAAYSATKSRVVGLTQALHKELGERRHPVHRALPRRSWPPPMTDWVEGVPKEEMIQPEDIAEAVRFLLRTSPACIVPEIQFIRPGDVAVVRRSRSASPAPSARRPRAPRVVERGGRVHAQPRGASSGSVASLGPAMRRGARATPRSSQRRPRQRDARLEHRRRACAARARWPARARRPAPV